MNAGGSIQIASSDSGINGYHGSMPFSFQELDLPGLILVKPQVFRDARGEFLEVFKESEFLAAGLPGRFVQENYSSSVRGVLRGLHYQKAPKAQGKLVRVLSGEILDVVVDLRAESPTCGQWRSVVLSAANRDQLYVPAGFAHGFCVTSERVEVAYLVTEEYSPGDEGGVAWNDARLNIEWPVAEPIVSARDQQWPPFEPMPSAFFGGGGGGA